jgi:hypothetical protein
MVSVEYDRIWDLDRAAGGPRVLILPAWEAETLLKSQPERYTRTGGEALDRVCNTAIAQFGGKPMVSLGDVAARVRQKKIAHDALAEEWAAQLDYIDKQEPALMAAGDAMISQTRQNMEDMKTSFGGMMANLSPPKAESVTSPPKSPAVTPAPAASAAELIQADLKAEA